MDEHFHLISYSPPTIDLSSLNELRFGIFWRMKKSKKSTLRRRRFEANKELKATGKRPYVRVIYPDRKRFPQPKGSFGVIEDVVFIN